MGYVDTGRRRHKRHFSSGSRCRGKRRSDPADGVRGLRGAKPPKLLTGRVRRSYEISDVDGSGALSVAAYRLANLLNPALIVYQLANKETQCFLGIYRNASVCLPICGKLLISDTLLVTKRTITVEAELGVIATESRI